MSSQGIRLFFKFGVNLTLDERRIKLGVCVLQLNL